ncbi:hypothetical protein [Seohaeicola zhoushanensis]|uniref:Uncharacterized protein n=1 Tax=Seohaeicola zhoushanensis TaxID=1569283 RepID=A0A8J3GZP7_9RHOB|nr:hypothetical protein [Seohaeicola zhoushanensis]GHF56413.1 hypothetical protein GCM10017056_30030 [Seohaeicola zhoushanensis]
MTIMVMPERRGVLFEMPRRQNISEVSQRRISAQARDAAEAAAFLSSALGSWSLPETAPETSAPEPRSDDEFFRAVGA